RQSSVGTSFRRNSGEFRYGREVGHAIRRRTSPTGDSRGQAIGPPLRLAGLFSGSAAGTALGAAAGARAVPATGGELGRVDPGGAGGDHRGDRFALVQDSQLGDLSGVPVGGR